MFDYSAARRMTCLLLLTGSMLTSAHAFAQDITGSLVDLVNSDRFNFNRLERLSAAANQATYNQLIAGPCAVDQRAATATCAGNLFQAFNNVRELVETANELLGNGGPTQFSLGLSEQSLGFALRWTAAEELSAQGRASTEFTNNQLTSLMSRLTALRFGARGFNKVGTAAVRPVDRDDTLMAQEWQPAGGGAAGADDDEAGGFSPWGGFLDGTWGWGNRDPSQLEDAFDFDGVEATLAVDYRFNDRFVAGTLLGRTEQRIDFDSQLSIVDGGIRSRGISVIVYGQYEWDGPYLSASLGRQDLSHDTRRRISYPSFNPAVESVDATASGSTDSVTYTGTFNAGWAFARNAMSVDPYVRLDYRMTNLRGFKESSLSNSGSNAGQPAAFDFNFGDQKSRSFEAVLGFSTQYTFGLSFGVVMPFLRAEYHRELTKTPFRTPAIYNAIASAAFQSAPDFNLPSDAPDADFYTLAAGTSLVLKYGWQSFIQFQSVGSLNLLTNYVITGGLRTEF